MVGLNRGAGGQWAALGALGARGIWVGIPTVYRGVGGARASEAGLSHQGWARPGGGPQGVQSYVRSESGWGAWAVLGEQGAVQLGGIPGWGEGGGRVGSPRRVLEPGRGMGDWYTGKGENFRWSGGVGYHGATLARDRSEWGRSTDMATTTWVTLRVDGLKPPFSTGKDESIFTAMHFNLDERAAESVVNFPGIDILTIAYKEAGRGGGGTVEVLIDERIEAFSNLVGLF